jgi:hypothetical protein
VERFTRSSFPANPSGRFACAADFFEGRRTVAVGLI